MKNTKHRKQQLGLLSFCINKDQIIILIQPGKVLRKVGHTLEIFEQPFSHGWSVLGVVQLGLSLPYSLTLPGPPLKGCTPITNN